MNIKSQLNQQNQGEGGEGRCWPEGISGVIVSMAVQLDGYD